MPSFNRTANIAKYNYLLNVNDQGLVKEFEYTMEQKYWTPIQLQEMLYESGFNKVHLFKHLTFDDYISSDYKLSVVCIK